MRRELGTPLIVTGVFVAGLAACLSAYLLYGHYLLAAVHSGRAFLLFSRLAGDRTLPLGQYLYGADEAVFHSAVTAFVSFFFYLFLALVVRRLLRCDADSWFRCSSQPSGTRVPTWAGAALVYTLLTAAYFYPVLPHITSQLIGPAEDNVQHLWDVWWARHALSGRLDFLHTTSIYWPEGGSLLFHPFSSYNLLVALTLGRPFSPVTIYNLLILSTFVLSGVGAFLLIRHITEDTAAALLGGFVFAFNPSHLAHSLHHIEIASIQFIPFFVLYYLKTLADGSRRDVAWASVFFLLNSLCSWYYMVYALFCMAACYGIEAYRRRRLLLRRPLISSLMIVGATFVVLSPLAVRMLLHALRHPGVWTGGYGAFAVDVLGLFVPHYLQSGGIPLVERINVSYSGFPWESVGYLGVICVGFLLASGRVLVERAARYVLGLIFFMVLSFGPSLRVMGRQVASVLPYAAIQHIPILSGARAPGRMMAYVYLLLGALVAVAFSYQRREGFLRRRTWAAALIALGICADFWTPCRQMTTVRLPAAYTAILEQEQTVDFGILDLPNAKPFRGTYMMYQTVHGIPIVQGYLARKSSPTLVDSLAFDDLPAQRERLRSARVKYIVVHRRFLAAAAAEGDGLDLDRCVEAYEPFYMDEENLVLRVY